MPRVQTKGKDATHRDCPFCGEKHKRCTGLLDKIASPELTGWLVKNSTTKLNFFNDVLKGYSILENLETAKAEAEHLWLKAHKTPFWKSGRDIGGEAADYGTLAHNFIENYFKGTIQDVKKLPEPSQKAVGGFLEWVKEHNVVCHSTEIQTYNCDLGYAGKYDFDGEVDGLLTLADWKTSGAIYPKYVVQSWNYADTIERRNPDKKYEQVLIGRFGKDGDYEVKTYKRDEFPSKDLCVKLMEACVIWQKFEDDWKGQHSKS